MSDKVKVQDLDPAAQELIKEAIELPCARFGDIGYTLPVHYKPDANNFRNMAIRPDDVWITSFPRSGTTYTQELVWLLKNDCNFAAASETFLFNRYIFIERTYVHSVPKSDELERVDAMMRDEISKMFKTYDEIVNAPSPRFLQTHLPFSLLPPNLLDTNKVVYVARDPRDVAVSYYHLYKLTRFYSGQFKTFWDLFINNLVIWAPYIPHVKEAWALRHHTNMMFIFYENMIKDLPSYIRKISDFLGTEVTSEQIVKLCEHMDIRNFKKNERSVYISVTPHGKGVDIEDSCGSGGWREYFDEEMAAQAQRWLRANLADTDLRFPQQDAS